jgi:hypothetical protein
LARDPKKENSAMNNLQSIPSDCKASISEVVARYGVELRRGGKEQVGLCPFHADKHPSMSVSEDKGLFHCFACGASGDVIRFVELIENIPFKEACRRLELDTFKPRQRPHRAEAEKILSWATTTSKKICAAMRVLGELIDGCSLARKDKTLPCRDPERWKFICTVEMELIRRWAILEDFDDDLNNPERVLDLWKNRADVERLVEMA